MLIHLDTHKKGARSLKTGNYFTSYTAPTPEPGPLSPYSIAETSRQASPHCRYRWGWPASWCPELTVLCFQITTRPCQWHHHWCQVGVKRIYTFSAARREGKNLCKPKHSRPALQTGTTCTGGTNAHVQDLLLSTKTTPPRGSWGALEGLLQSASTSLLFCGALGPFKAPNLPVDALSELQGVDYSIQQVWVGVILPRSLTSQHIPRGTRGSH